MLQREGAGQQLLKRLQRPFNIAAIAATINALTAAAVTHPAAATTNAATTTSTF